MRVVRLWRQRTNSSSEVIDIVLPTTNQHITSHHTRTHTIPYYAQTDLQRARPYPQALRASPSQLRHVVPVLTSCVVETEKTHARTERGIIVPPNITLCTTH